MWIDKKVVMRNFSRYANVYDKYAGIQRAAAHELMKEVPYLAAGNILEIGCGTAYYTRLLRQRFKTAHIKAIDISSEMIEIAGRNLSGEGIELIAGDAEDIELGDKFDLVTSNAVFQWLGNFEKAVSHYKGMLREKGSLVFSMFGPGTFWELRRALGKSLKQEGVPITSNNFMGQEEIRKTVSNYFAKATLREITIKEDYACLMELLAKIKYTGTRGNGWNQAFLRRRSSLAAIEDAYKSEFGKIEASYQIFFCKARQ